MFELKPKYIDRFSIGRVATIALILSVALSICMNIGFSIIYDSRSSRPATTNEIIDYWAVIMISIFSYFLAFLLAMKMRDTLADSSGPLLPVLVLGFMFFVVLFSIYVYGIGLGNEKLNWFAFQLT